MACVVVIGVVAVRWPAGAVGVTAATVVDVSRVGWMAEVVEVR